MNDLTAFNFGEKEVRTINIDSQVWFVAKDIAEILEYSETEKMTRRLDNDEKTTIPFRGNGSNYQTNITIINESGLYNAILGSNKPEAKVFRKWVTSEVLPNIRKNGKYESNQTKDNYLEIIDRQMKVIERLIDNHEHIKTDKTVKEKESDSAVWITTIELAELLECTRSTAISRALRAGWDKRVSSLRGYLTHEYNLNSLPTEVQEKYIKRQGEK